MNAIEWMGELRQRVDKLNAAKLAADQAEEDVVSWVQTELEASGCQVSRQEALAKAYSVLK